MIQGGTSIHAVDLPSVSGSYHKEEVQTYRLSYLESLNTHLGLGKAASIRQR
jgi:hypothetical protein